MRKFCHFLVFLFNAPPPRETLPSLPRRGLRGGLIIAFLFIFLTNSASASLILNHPNYTGLNQGLVGYWSFDGKDMAGTKAYDKSGNGNNGTITNGPVQIEGKIGQALNFDGVDDYVGMSSVVSSPLSLRNPTYSAYPASSIAGVSVVANDLIIIGYSYSAGNMGPNCTDNAAGGSNSYNRIDGTTLSSSAAFGHIFYAVAKATETLTISCTAENDNGLSIHVVSGNNITLASVLDSSNTGEQNAGTSHTSASVTSTNADDYLFVFWYQETLITSLTENGTGFTKRTEQTSHVHHTFDRIVSSTGTYSDSVTSADSSYYANIIAAFKKAADVGGGVGNVNTVSFWFKPNSTTESIIDLDGTRNIDISGGTVRANNFTSPKIYIDGSEASTISNTDWHLVTVSTNSAISASSFTVGKISSAYFHGQIDDVRIYNRALSADEIKRLYKIGGTLHVNTTNIGNNDTLKNGLVGYWSFDGKDMAGVTAYDKSGQNNNGTLTNGPVQIEGKLGQAMSFDGVNDYVSVLHNSSLNTPSAITISMWVKHTGTVAGGNRWLMSKGDFATGWDLANSADGGSLNFRFGASGNHSSSGNLMPFRQWAHIVITFDSSTQRVRFYSNTVLDSEISETGTISSNSTALDIATDSSASASFGGSIDDVRIYNRVLTADEIKRLYKIGGTLHVNTSNVGNNDTLKNGLVGYWSFDGKDMAGTKAYDKSGQNNNGTLTNGPTQIEGKIGQALNFDGVDDKVSVGSGNSLNITGDITISAWINKSALSNNAFPRIFERLVTNGYMLSIDDSSGTNNGIIFSAASTVSLSTTVIKPRTWQHIVVTLRSTTATLYVDGILSGSATTNPAGNNAGDTGWIGGRGLDNNRQFDGQIDDVRIYNRALNQNEIKRLYNLGR